jgi:hypothetical protein
MAQPIAWLTHGKPSLSRRNAGEKIAHAPILPQCIVWSSGEVVREPEIVIIDGCAKNFDRPFPLACCVERGSDHSAVCLPRRAS